MHIFPYAGLSLYCVLGSPEGEVLCEEKSEILALATLTSAGEEELRRMAVVCRV